MAVQALDSLGAGVFVLDASNQGGPLVYVNAALGSLLGREKHELLGSSLVSLLDCKEHGYARTRQQLFNILDALGEAVLDLPFQGPEGKVLWAEVRLSPCPDGQFGGVAHMVGVCLDITGRKAEHVRVSCSALQNMSEAVWMGGPCGSLTYVNTAFTRLTGFTSGEVLGRSWELLQGTGSDAAAVERLTQAMASGRPCSEELLCHSKGGRVFWARLCVSPMVGSSAGGAEGAHVAIFTDISAHKSCSTTSQLCEQALASTSEGILITDPTLPDNPIIYANAAFERLTGYTKAEVLGRNCRFLQGPDSDPVSIAELAEARTELRPVVVEVVNYKKDRTPFWNQISITPILDSEGAVVSFVAVQQDITERRVAEEALQMRDKALSNLSEGITISDPNLPDCPVVYCNDAFLRITGFSRQEVVGRNCRFLQGPATDAAAVDRLRSAVREGREVTVELLNYRKGGEPFWNLLSITPVRDAGGRVTSMIGVQSDITDLIRRRQVERELQEAKAAAETAREAKSLFLANMSHEIRTPLNGMIVAAQLLLTAALSPEERELVDTMLESSNTLLSILGDILDFSKIEQHSMVLDSCPLCLRDVVEASMEQVAGDAHRKGLHLAYSLDPQLALGAVLGDSIRIRQVLVSLLSNAVKFTEEGEVVVNVGLEIPSQEGGGLGKPRVHFAVRDTGIGIGPAVMQKLFHCFRQGHESMSRKYGGTGLGLAIARRLAELMGGTVWVESREGEGSTFHFTMLLGWAGDGAEGREKAPQTVAGNPPVATLQPQPLHTATEAAVVEGRGACSPPSKPAAAGASKSGEEGRSGGGVPLQGGGDLGWAAVELHRQQQHVARSWASSMSLHSTSVAPGTPSEGREGAAEGLLRAGAAGFGKGGGFGRRFLGSGGLGSSSTSLAFTGTASLSGTSMGGGHTPSGSSGCGARRRGSMDAPSRSSRDTLPSRNSSEMVVSPAVGRVASPARGCPPSARTSFAFPTTVTGSAADRAGRGEGEGEESGAGEGLVLQRCGGAELLQPMHSGGSMHSSTGACSGVSAEGVGSLQPPPPVDYRLSSLYGSAPPTSSQLPTQPLHLGSHGNIPSSPLVRPLGTYPAAATQVFGKPLAGAPSYAAVARQAASIMGAAGSAAGMGHGTGQGVPAAQADDLHGRGATSATGLERVREEEGGTSPRASGAGVEGGGSAEEGLAVNPVPARCSPANGVSPCRQWAHREEEELEQLRGKSVVVVVAHRPTALQIQESCELVGMRVVEGGAELAAHPPPPTPPAAAAGPATDSEGTRTAGSRWPLSSSGGSGSEQRSCSRTSTDSSGAESVQLIGGAAARAQQAGSDRGAEGMPSLEADFCITTCDAAPGLLRAGWRGRPVVAVGMREELPISIHPLVCGVPPPVKHCRLLGALLKAAAYMGSKVDRVPLLTQELDCATQLLSLLPERQRLQALQVGHNRASLDNSLLHRPYALARAAGPRLTPPHSPPRAATTTAAVGGREARCTPRSGHCSAPAALPHSTVAAAAAAVAAQQGAPPEGEAARGLAGVLYPAPPSATPFSPFLEGGTAAWGGGGRPSSVPQKPLPGPGPEGCKSEGGSGGFGGEEEEEYPQLRILIAEDNLINQRVVKKVLQRVLPSATPDLVVNGIEVLEAVSRKQYDLILMDIHMPEMDGLEASRQIQERLPPERRPVIVALSADTLQALHERCRSVGIREFISKPFRVEDVKRVLQLVQRSVQVAAG